jgi:hypothetical protein
MQAHRWVKVLDPAIRQCGGTAVAWLLPGELPMCPAGGFAFLLDGWAEHTKSGAGQRMVLYAVDVG